MTELERLEQEAHDQNIHLDYSLLHEDDTVAGLYICGQDGTKVILLNKHLNEATLTAVLAEELGHHYTCCANIVAQDTVEKRKIEFLGRKHAIRRLVPIDVLEGLLRSGISEFFEAAEELDMPETFIREAYAYYFAI